MPIALVVIAALCFVLDRQFSRWQKGQANRWAKTGLVLVRICVWVAIVSALLSALMDFVISRREASKEVAEGPIIVSTRPVEIKLDKPYHHSHQELYVCLLPGAGFHVDSSPPGIVSAQGRGQLWAVVSTSEGVSHELSVGRLRSDKEGTFLCLGSPENVHGYTGATIVSVSLKSNNEVILSKLRLLGESPK